MIHTGRKRALHKLGHVLGRNCTFAESIIRDTRCEPGVIATPHLRKNVQPTVRISSHGIRIVILLHGGRVLFVMQSNQTRSARFHESLGHACTLRLALCLRKSHWLRVECRRVHKALRVVVLRWTLKKYDIYEHPHRVH